MADSEVMRLRRALQRIVDLDAQDYLPHEAAAAFDRAVTIAHVALGVEALRTIDALGITEEEIAEAENA